MEQIWRTAMVRTHVLRTLYNYLCSLSAPMRIGLMLGTPLLGVPLLLEMLKFPLWGVVLGLLIGGWAYWQADSRSRFYRQKVILAIFLPSLLTNADPWPFDQISTGATVFTIVGLAIIC